MLLVYNKLIDFVWTLMPGHWNLLVAGKRRTCCFLYKYEVSVQKRKPNEVLWWLVWSSTGCLLWHTTKSLKRNNQTRSLSTSAIVEYLTRYISLSMQFTDTQRSLNWFICALTSSILLGCSIWSIFVDILSFPLAVSKTSISIFSSIFTCVIPALPLRKRKQANFLRFDFSDNKLRLNNELTHAQDIGSKSFYFSKDEFHFGCFLSL